MAGSTRDPFRPPEQKETPLELATGTPPAPTAAEPLLPPAPRAKVVYPRPAAGLSNLILWSFAAIGFVSVAAAAGWYWKSRATSAPAKEVVWRSLPRTDDVLVTVEILPAAAAGTRLLVDGDPAPSNPLLLPRGSVHQIAAVADGFAGATLEVVADEPKTVRLRLTWNPQRVPDLPRWNPSGEARRVPTRLERAR